MLAGQQHSGVLRSSDSTESTVIPLNYMHKLSRSETAVAQYISTHVKNHYIRLDPDKQAAKVNNKLQIITYYIDINSSK